MMILKERVFLLIANSGKSDNSLTREIGLNNTAIADWRRKTNANPSAEAIIKIAKYFNVSTDYLLGLTDNPAPHYE
ncbi:MAG: helix-turn-helix domain-containing protein [Firmicutes bacterium]|nr:helix-turn-helix domain-containing protein [Bacillota bacterium]